MIVKIHNLQNLENRSAQIISVNSDAMQSRFNTILKILMDHYDKIMTIPGNINVLSDTNEKINNRKNVGLCFGLNPSIYCVAYSWGSVFRHYKVIFFKHRRVIGFLCQQM